MSIQTFIDAIDPSKPVNRTATQKPTLKSLRDNTAAIKNALQAIEDGATTQNTTCIPMVLDGFNEDIVYVEGNRKVPNFCTTDSGNFYYVGI